MMCVELTAMGGVSEPSDQGVMQMNGLFSGVGGQGGCDE